MTQWKLLISIILIACYCNAFAQKGKIEIPRFDDKYSRYVQQLESGKLDIDYAEFRDSFLDSKQFDRKDTAYDNAKKSMFQAAQDGKDQNVMELAQKMLSIDYTSMVAHKYLSLAYKYSGDSLNYHKHFDIEMGLIRSITKSGDGKTCETGWHATQIEEEYFLIRMIEGDFKSQSLIYGKNNTCDKMEFVNKEGKTEYIFFEINKLFESEMKAFKK